MSAIERFAAKCSRWLEHLIDSLCCKVAEEQNKKRSSYREFVLRDELNKQRRDKKFLQLQLTKARADFHELRQRPQSLRDEIAQLLCMPDGKLREISRFHVQRNAANSWETVTGFCCLGGCDMDAYSFQTERDALLFSALLKTVAYQPPHNIACPACYEEYMSENLQGGIEPYAE